MNHASHNTAFFYALLIVAKCSGRKAEERYAVKHYLLRRDDDCVYEIPDKHVELVDEQLVWPTNEMGDHPVQSARDTRGNVGRVYDRDILAEFYRDTHRGHGQLEQQRHRRVHPRRVSRSFGRRRPVSTPCGSDVAGC